jgi:acetyltransferase
MSGDREDVLDKNVAATRALPVIDAARKQEHGNLSEHEAKQVLEAYGIPVTRERLVTDIDQLASTLSGFAFPVVLKIDSPDILHKTEGGLIALDCRSSEEAEAEFLRILRHANEYHPHAAVNGILVQEMVTGCVAECIVGVKKDPQFGPTVLFGLGGIFVEVFEDVALRVPPLTELDAISMIRDTKGYKLLAGVRGRPRADVTAIEDVLLKMSRLALDLEEFIAEIDINPLMVGAEGSGAKAADALMILDPARRTG